MRNGKSLIALIVTVTVLLSSLPIVLFSAVADDNVSNLVETIAFDENYAAAHRNSDGIPNWRYFSSNSAGSDGRTELIDSDNAIEFMGITNAGNSYGNRAVLISNDYTKTLLEAGNRYKIVFDLLFKF